MTFGQKRTLDERENSMTQEFYDLVEDAPMGVQKFRGKKADIKRCPTILADREKYLKLLKKRHAVDLKIMRGLCANGIPFNVLCNPQFHEMVMAINKAPPGYKAPSSEKARTAFLDECSRDIEKDLTSIQDTWFTQGVSIVSDGEAIAKYLLRAIEKIGPGHVLQVVTNNAANYKAVGKEIKNRDEQKNQEPDRNKELNRNHKEPNQNQNHRFQFWFLKCDIFRFLDRLGSTSSRDIAAIASLCTPDAVSM
nr:hypothetical protein [Tanacetum cinerariifolium]